MRSFHRVTMTMTMSFLARALSSIQGNYFCYTAISSASIVGILPGFLIRKFRSHHSALLHSLTRRHFLQ